ncbi:hypothetical protein M9Y10_007976 [Tritrichomonas musculus]|uniref:Uncharacterized protein n=1 Tax=Tritrichomonas musculus TaxID=1915356 RepID=A0ABR2J356_9EUKA
MEKRETGLSFKGISRKSYGSGKNLVSENPKRRDCFVMNKLYFRNLIINGRMSIIHCIINRISQKIAQMTLNIRRNGHRAGNGPEINVLPGHALANLRAKWAARAKRLFTFFRAKQWIN